MELPIVAICVKNEGYEASLMLNKMYYILSDNIADKYDQIRIVDESGEDYLYPKEYFQLGKGLKWLN